MVWLLLFCDWFRFELVVVCFLRLLYWFVFWVCLVIYFVCAGFDLCLLWFCRDLDFLVGCIDLRFWWLGCYLFVLLWWIDLILCVHIGFCLWCFRVVYAVDWCFVLCLICWFLVWLFILHFVWVIRGLLVDYGIVIALLVDLTCKLVYSFVYCLL